MNHAPSRQTAALISCIVCAFDEGPRIAAVLAIATAHPLIAEVIVVDDGSTDDTAQVVARFPSVRLVSHPINAGKSRAVATGVAAARHDLLMLLDADLAGLRPDDLTALARPVLDGDAAVSLSLRGNSLAGFRWIGIDVVSGERVMHRRLLEDVLDDVQRLPRFGIEVFVNRRIAAARLPLAIADWPSVSQARKTAKVGWWRGTVGEGRMIVDLLRTASPLELLAQTISLLALQRRHASGSGVASSARQADSPRLVAWLNPGPPQDSTARPSVPRRRA